MSTRATRLGVAALVLAGAALALPALAQDKQAPAPRIERRFDHDGHARAMAAKGKPAEGCTARCHGIDRDGRWIRNGKTEHDRCTGACHTFSSSCDALAAGPGKVCVTCHVNLKAACVPRGTPRLAGTPASMPARYSHAKHMAGADASKSCAGCHAGYTTRPAGRGATPGHAACASCHGRSATPAMPTCDGCHARGAAAAAAARPADPFAVTGAFDHGRHARAERVGAAGEACLTCHDNLATSTDDRALPMPAMRGCYQRCHDGRRAFSATADTCTRCHKGGRK